MRLFTACSAFDLMYKIVSAVTILLTQSSSPTCYSGTAVQTPANLNANAPMEAIYRSQDLHIALIRNQAIKT